MPRAPAGCAGVLLLALGAAAAAAPDRITTPRTEVRLVADVASVAPLRPFWVGLRFALAPGWHTYWRNPGDSGLAARIEWGLPPGVAAGAIRWPAPKRFRTGGSVSYGYADEVVLLTRVSPAPGAALGDLVRIEARARWLVCADVCIPEEGRLALELPRAAGEPVPDPAGARALARALARVPAAGGAGAYFEASAARLDLTVPLAGGEPFARAWFYPYEFGVVEHAAPQPVRTARDALTLALARGELRGGALARLRGVLVLGFEDGRERGIAIDAAAR